jgi:ribosomal-protein-alanine N-acetyltransferase
MMSKHFILERPSLKRQDEFLAAVVRSRKLHRHWASPPSNATAFRENLKRLRSVNHVGYWVCTEDGELAGAININEIVRGVFCSGYLGYYAFVPHNGRGYMKSGLRACWRTHFFGTDYIGLRRISNLTTKHLDISFRFVDLGWKGSRLDI